MLFRKALDVAQMRERMQASNDEALRVVLSLTPLQTAGLRAPAQAGAGDAPLDTRTLARYRATSAAVAPDAKVAPKVNNVQQALKDCCLAELMRQAGMRGP